jgi:hypothetical protein
MVLVTAGIVLAWAPPTLTIAQPRAAARGRNFDPYARHDTSPFIPLAYKNRQSRSR